MEIKAGDYVRSTVNGQLYQVQFVGTYGVHALRIHDNKMSIILNEFAQVVTSMSAFPGDPETTRRAS